MTTKSSNREPKDSETIMTTTVRAASCILVLVLVQTGCLSLSREYAEKTYFVIEAEREAASGNATSSDVGEIEPGTAGAAARALAGTLAVRPLRVAAGFEARQLVYATGDRRFESDFYNEYFLPAPTLVTNALRDWIDDARLFDSVVGEGSLIDADYVLEGSLRKMYGDYSERDAPAAVVELQVLLLRNGDRGAEIVLQENFESRTQIARRSARALVDGLGSALTDVLTRLEASILELERGGT